MYKKTKQLGWKVNHGIGIEESKGNITADVRQIPTIWENYYRAI
jgi:hypothetical protein